MILAVQIDRAISIADLIPVKVRNSYTDIRHHAGGGVRRIKGRQHVGHGLAQNLKASRSIDRISHRTGGIQHEDHVHALAHGNAGGRQFDLGHAGFLEIDALAGLFHTNRTLVGILGIVVFGFRRHMEGIVRNRLAPVCNRQAGVIALHVLIEVPGKHTEGDVQRPCAAIGVGNSQLGAGLCVVGGTRLDCSFHGSDFNVRNGQCRNDDRCRAKNFVLIGNRDGVLAGFSLIAGVQRPGDIRIIIRKRCLIRLVRRFDHIDAGLHRGKGILRRSSRSYRICQRTRQLCIFSRSL